MPLMYPRATATIIDAATAKFLARYDFPFEALQPQDEGALNRLLESQLPSSVERSLDGATRAVADRMADLADAVATIDPTLAGAARSAQGKMEHELHTLQDKIIRAAKRRDETLRASTCAHGRRRFPTASRRSGRWGACIS